MTNQEFDLHHVWHPYTSLTHPLPCYEVASVKGVTLTLTDGRELVDGMSSWWACVHGYQVPELDAAATNVLVIATFWMNYAAARGDKDEQASIRDGIVQVMMLIAPFLRDAERVHLNTLTRAYIE